MAAIETNLFVSLAFPFSKVSQLDGIREAHSEFESVLHHVGTSHFWVLLPAYISWVAYKMWIYHADRGKLVFILMGFFIFVFVFLFLFIAVNLNVTNTGITNQRRHCKIICNCWLVGKLSFAFLQTIPQWRVMLWQKEKITFEILTKAPLLPHTRKMISFLTHWCGVGRRRGLL